MVKSGEAQRENSVVAEVSVKVFWDEAEEMRVILYLATQDSGMLGVPIRWYRNLSPFRQNAQRNGKGNVQFSLLIR